MRSISTSKKAGTQTTNGLPALAWMIKMEETPGDYVDEFGDYNNYARDELTDWNMEKPFLESDAPRKSSAYKDKLNLRLNATRGSYPDLPKHPELFMGFTDRDPRGTSGDPRFEGFRRDMMHRVEKFAQMGNNADGGISERPWTGQSISYAQKETMKRVGRNTKVFNYSVESQARGYNPLFPLDTSFGYEMQRQSEDVMTHGHTAVAQQYGASTQNPEQNLLKYAVDDVTRGKNKINQQGKGAHQSDSIGHFGETTQKRQEHRTASNKLSMMMMTAAHTGGETTHKNRDGSIGKTSKSAVLSKDIAAMVGYVEATQPRYDTKTSSVFKSSHVSDDMNGIRENAQASGLFGSTSTASSKAGLFDSRDTTRIHENAQASGLFGSSSTSSSSKSQQETDKSRITYNAEQTGVIGSTRTTQSYKSARPVEEYKMSWEEDTIWGKQKTTSERSTAPMTGRTSATDDPIGLTDMDFRNSHETHARGVVPTANRKNATSYDTLDIVRTLGDLS
jgi:hypothetical protein